MIPACELCGWGGLRPACGLCLWHTVRAVPVACGRGSRASLVSRETRSHRTSREANNTPNTHIIWALELLTRVPGQRVRDTGLNIQQLSGLFT